MKKLFGAILLTLLFVIASFPQSKPVMYFCEKYDAKQGEIGVSSTFYTGYFTVMVKADNIISYDTDVSIQIDRRNSDGSYEFYKVILFEIPESSYIYFSDKRLYINDVGIYRVWLIDSRDKAIAWATIEIVK